MDLSGSKEFFAYNAEIWTGAGHSVEMGADEVFRRRQLLFWLWKRHSFAAMHTVQPLLLRQDWRVELGARNMCSNA